MKVSTWLQICNNMKLWVVCLTRKSYVWKVVILSFVLFICVLQWVSNCKGHNFSTRNLPPPPPMVMIMASIFKCNAHISKSNQPVLHKSLSIVHYIQMHTTIWKIKYLLPFHYDFNEHNQCESDKTSANKHLSATTFYFNSLFSRHKPIPVRKCIKCAYFLNVMHKIPLQILAFGAKCPIIRHEREHIV